MISYALSRFQRLAAASAAALLLATNMAQADFRGGGAVFGFTETCAQFGWRVNGSHAAWIRYAASENNPAGAPPSQITVNFPTLTENLTLWGAFTPSTTFFGAAGRSIGTYFVFYPQRPLIRVVQRVIVERVNPAGPATIQNARQVVLRLRVQNFNNLPGCSVTIAANLRRAN